MEEESARMDDDHVPSSTAPLDSALEPEGLPARRLYANPRAEDDADAEMLSERPLAEVHGPVEIRWQDAPPAPVIESGESLRPGVLFVSSPTLLEANITTAMIMKWVNLWSSGCKGLEWISDTSLCLVYDSLEAALGALNALSVPQDAQADITALSEAIERLSNIYDAPLTADMELIGQARPVRPFRPSAEESLPAPFARLALVTDIKEKKAAKKSTFYQRNGIRAGKGTTELQDRLGGRRPAKTSDNRDAALSALDAELDAFRARNDGAPPDEENVRRRGRGDRSETARDRARRERDYSRDRRKREALDAELESFAQRDEESEPTDARRAKSPTPQEVIELLEESVATRGGKMVASSLWDEAGELDPDERGDFIGYRQTRTANKPKLNYGREKASITDRIY